MVNLLIKICLLVRMWKILGSRIYFNEKITSDLFSSETLARVCTAARR